ncbi:MAG: 16S rRNA (cytosine(967)-C(5))-methyltransferase RsmB, partial [Candidatus Neomarinimicrobiota bacterium]
DQYYIERSLNSDLRMRAHVLSRETIRWKNRLDAMIGLVLDRPVERLQKKLLILLELGTCELTIDQSVPVYATVDSMVALARSEIGDRTTGLVNAVLRSVSRLKKSDISQHMDIYQELAYPKWLYDRWNKNYGEMGANALCTYFNKQPPLTIRRNVYSCSVSDIMNMAEETDIKLDEIPGTDIYYNVRSGGQILLSHEYFKTGRISIQDRAAGLAVELLDPGHEDVILDVCAAPGTKSLYLAEILGNSGKVFASDISLSRVEKAQSDQQRHGMKNIFWDVRDAVKDEFPAADAILVDAPCSGTGVIGRRPDIKWRRKPKDIKQAAALQLAILNNMQKYLKDSGTLLYSTCSLEEEENWQVAEAFLKLNPHYKIVNDGTTSVRQWMDTSGCLRTYPPEDNQDGMFAIKMVKAN